MITLDIRWPLGLLFALVGAILFGYGAWSRLPAAGAEAIDMARGADSVNMAWGVNSINLAWGGVLLVFGVAMLWLARRAARQARA